MRLTKFSPGDWTHEEAVSRSTEEHARLLPQGLATQHFLYTIEFEEKLSDVCGFPRDPTPAGAAGFIFDVYLEEAFRGRGLATQALKLLEAEAARLGLKRLSLHVFGFNCRRALYNRLGYQITNLNLSKELVRGLRFYGPGSFDHGQPSGYSAFWSSNLSSGKMVWEK